MEHFARKAAANVERFLGDLPEECINNADSFYEEVYTLAHDGAVDAGATMEQAQAVAQYIAQQF